MYDDEYCSMGPRGRFYSYIYIYIYIYISSNVDDWDRWFLGRAPRTRETLPDFCESCRVTRHSRVFCRLTGSQRTPQEWGVTAWYQSLGIRIPRALGLGFRS